ncbi:MAG: 2'-5' RNA ligase family protein [Halanaerobiales bacterium]
MIENSTFKNQYFVVLKPKGDVLELAELLQKKLSQEFDLYPEGLYPEIHITLDRIKKSRIDEALKIIKNTILKYTKIDIMVKDFDCYSFQDNNFLVLNVEDSKKLTEFSNELHDRLAEKNISTIDNYEQWKFHISLASTVFSETKKDFKNEFQNICFRFDGIQTPRECKAEVIEIWRPTLNEDIKCLKQFQL